MFKYIKLCLHLVLFILWSVEKWNCSFVAISTKSLAYVSIWLIFLPWLSMFYIIFVSFVNLLVKWTFHVANMALRSVWGSREIKQILEMLNQSQCGQKLVTMDPCLSCNSRTRLRKFMTSIYYCVLSVGKQSGSGRIDLKVVLWSSSSLIDLWVVINYPQHQLPLAYITDITYQYNLPSKSAGDHFFAILSIPSWFNIDPNSPLASYQQCHPAILHLSP